MGCGARWFKFGCRRRAGMRFPKAECLTPAADYSRNPGFTETRLRPLARRREITARPCLVFIRVRKPCTLERRRRFGWNVRFGMKSGALLSSATALLQSKGERKV